MNLVSVPRIQLADQQDMGMVIALLEKMQPNPLDAVPWPQYAYRPEVQFRIAHNGSSIFIHFHVREAALRAAVWEPNGPVWEDSCVEFFIAFDATGYYNLECNAIGTMHAAYGQGRDGRLWVDPRALGSIRRQAVIRPGAAGTEWTMTLQVPASVFVHHDIVSFSGKNAAANFYKCGDRVPQPHYLAWNPVQAPEPDFHLPQYFGTLHFNHEP